MIETDEKTYVAVADEVQLNTHASNIGSTHVRPVHETDAVHGPHRDNQAAVDAADDAALLGLGEAKVIVFQRSNTVVALRVFHRVIDMAEFEPLLFRL